MQKVMIHCKHGVKGMDKEINAMKLALEAVKDLEPEAQKRVMKWVSDRLNLSVYQEIPSNTQFSSSKLGRQPLPLHDHHGLAGFDSLAELLGCTNVKTDTNRVLVAAAYEQEKNRKRELTGREINRELQHIGHRVGNVTRAIDQLKAKRPQLMIQLKKEGSTQQAKKKYRVTIEGVKAVEALIRGDSMEAETK
jgi:hypothetical protein